MLHRRPGANGVKPARHYVVRTPQNTQVRQHLGWAKSGDLFASLKWNVCFNVVFFCQFSRGTKSIHMPVYLMFFLISKTARV